MKTNYSILICILGWGLTFQELKASSYDSTVLNDKPVLYFAMKGPNSNGKEKDLSGNKNHGVYFLQGSSVLKSSLPNGDTAVVFNGQNEYLEVPSHWSLSVPKNGALTFEAWIRPYTLNFPQSESDGYVYWAGKGEMGDFEYAGRMYSYQNSASRPNRISGYAFNRQGGLGSGSYFQDVVKVKEWIHVAVVIDTHAQVNAPTGTVSIFKNGMLRKTTPLNQFNVIPEPGNAPLRIATRDFHSFFKGSVAKFAIYPRSLNQATLTKHFNKMFP